MTDHPGTAAVDVITHFHRYSGRMVTRGHRIADVLNDSNSDLIEIHEVSVATGAAVTRDVRYDRVFLNKRHLLLVVPTGDYEAPMARLNKYVEKERYGAMITVPGHTFAGILHLPIRSDAVTLLGENTSLPAFLGLTEVSVHVSLHEFLRPEPDVLIFRRHAIESIEMTPMPLAKQGAQHPDAASVG